MQPLRRRLTVNTVCLEAKIDELEASIAEMKEMLGQREYSVKALVVCVSVLIFVLQLQRRFR